jgi:(p)ppGpp synthase/HD superfamily hydrolase
MIAKNFGKLIAEQVADLTRIKNGHKISSKELLELLWKQKKFNILLIKLLDRVHNVQTINAKSPQKAIKILRETLDSFLLIAAYLEVTDIENKFRRICCDYLMPKTIIKQNTSEEQSILENLISDSNLF